MKIIDPTQPHKVSTLSTSELVPTLFTPQASRHFVFDVTGIDSWLVKSVDVGMVSAKDDYKYVTVVYHVSQAPSTVQQVDEWMKSKKGRCGQLKLLDAVGNVVSLQTFHALKVENYEYSTFSYDNSDLMTLNVQMTYKTRKLVY